MASSSQPDASLLAVTVSEPFLHKEKCEYFVNVTKYFFFSVTSVYFFSLH